MEAAAALVIERAELLSELEAHLESTEGDAAGTASGTGATHAPPGPRAARTGSEHGAQPFIFIGTLRSREYEYYVALPYYSNTQ